MSFRCARKRDRLPQFEVEQRASFGLRVAAVSIAGWLMGSSALAIPASIDLPGDRVFPENITSGKDGTLYVGSLGSGGVIRIRAGAAKAEVWIKPGAFGSRSILGVLADEGSNTLWACSNDLSLVGVVTPGTETGSALKGFDLKTGAGKISAKLPRDRTACNDIAVGPDGFAYVTNSSAPQILRLPPGATQLEVWARDPLLAPPSGGGVGLDGIAFGADGNLYVDTYTAGEMFRVDVTGGKAGKVTKLKLSRHMVLADAIRPISKAFLIIEGAGRLDRVLMRGDEATIETIKDGYAVPTGVTTVGTTAWVSEGQLSYLFDPSKKGQTPNLPFHVYSVALPVH